MEITYILLRSKGSGGNARSQRWLAAKALLPENSHVHHDCYEMGGIEDELQKEKVKDEIRQLQ